MGSSRTTERDREAIREARNRVLDKAERKSHKEAERKKREKEWMLPDLEEQISGGKKRKKEKKDKKSKKHKKEKKKKRKKDKSSSSSDTSEEEDEWIEKKPTKPTTEEVKQPEPNPAAVQDARREMTKTKEQLEEEKKNFLV